MTDRVKKQTLKESAKRVPGEGPADAKICLIGEAPGADEERKGRPFIGASGRVLDHLLSESGIIRPKCYVTNVVKERPPRNNFGVFYEDSKRTRPKEALRRARQETLEEIKRINPNITVALGKEALKLFNGREEFSLDDWRGSTFHHPEVGKVIATKHPAFLVRQMKERNIVIMDLRLAAEEAKSPEASFPERELIVKPELPYIRNFLENCTKASHIAFDIETLGKGENRFIDCLSLAPSKDLSMCIPLASSNGQPIWSLSEEAEILLLLAKVLGDPSIKKIAQNGQYDIIFLERLGIPVRNLWFDTMNAANVLYPEYPKSLAFLSSVYTKEPPYKDTSQENRYLYNCKDSACTFEVAFKQIEELKEMGLHAFYFDHVHPLLRIYIDIHELGVRIDQEKFQAARERAEEEIQEIRDRLAKTSGTLFTDSPKGEPGINVNSSQQLGAYLEAGLGLKKLKKTAKGNYKTDEETLLEYYRKASGKPREILGLIRELREKRSELSKELKTKIDSDGRFRTAYLVSGTETGRLSSRKSVYGTGRNLQNVPKWARDMFIADPGKVLVGADLAQAENRAVAYFCEDENMLKIVHTSEYKIHTLNAALIFNKHPSEVNEREYPLGKRTTHGANYCMGPITFAKYAEVSTAEAKRLLERYHNTYPRLRLWHTEVEQQLRTTRRLENPFGRSRYFFGRVDSAMFRAGIAFLPQSTVADAIHRATRKLHPLLPQGAVILLQVHDALVVQCDKEDVDLVSNLMTELLTEPFTINGQELSIPVDLAVGSNWKEVG